MSLRPPAPHRALVPEAYEEPHAPNGWRIFKVDDANGANVYELRIRGDLSIDDREATHALSVLEGLVAADTRAHIKARIKILP